MKTPPLPFLRGKAAFAAALTLSFSALYQANASTYTVNSLSDSGRGTLRDAITQANAHTGADTIKFSVNLCGEIDLRTPLPQITGDVTIAGPGADKLTVAGNALVFDVGFGAVDISDLTIAAGNCDPQGAIHNRQASLTIEDSIVTSQNGGRGAGIINDAGGSLIVQNTAVVRISNPNGNGGGISNFGTLIVSNSTIANNSAKLGGGIYNAQSSSATFINATVSDNTASTSGGGLYNDIFSSVSLANTLVARNTKTDIVTQMLQSNGSTASGGPISSQGNNLIGSTTGSTGFVSSDLTNVSSSSLHLGYLANKGGATLVVELLTNSPARDAGNPANATDANGTPLLFDQRGAPFDRISGPAVDIGAFEAVEPTPPQNAHNYKELALTAIGAETPTGNAVNDFYFSLAADRISRSLDPSLWKDSDHLQSLLGIEVFVREQQAVWYLQQVSGDSTAQAVAQQAINDLVGADQALANTALNEAGSTLLNFVAQGFYNAGNNADDPFVAISDYEWAWVFSQLTLKRSCTQWDPDPLDCIFNRWGN